MEQVHLKDYLEPEALRQVESNLLLSQAVVNAAFDFAYDKIGKYEFDQIDILTHPLFKLYVQHFCTVMAGGAR